MNYQVQLLLLLYTPKVLGILLGCALGQTPLQNEVSKQVLASLALITSIQDVSLLTYALTHNTVNTASYIESNASSGLTASADDTYKIDPHKEPSRSQDLYTSDEQRRRDQYEIDEDNWHEVAFEEVNGSSTCRLALHNDWIIKHGYAVDGIVEMNLPEQGISGPFKITAIKHIIPQKKPVDEDPDDEWEYKPVTGLFTHRSDQVHTLAFASEDDSQVETLGVTAAHPIFSTTHLDWRLAGELEAGEKVLTYNGEATVLSNERKPGNEYVYNLEVKDLHNFLVGDFGVVVHNGCWKSYMESFFVKYTKKADPDNDWVDYIIESKPGSLKERQQLSRLGAYQQKRMTVLTKDKTGQDLPGIDGISDDGRPISLKEVTEYNTNTLIEKIKDIGKKGVNAKNNSLPQLVDLDGMVTATKFSKAEIKAAIDAARTNESTMSIVKKIFIEGSDGSEWY